MSQLSSAQQALAWLVAPTGNRENLSRALFLAAHPDDETIGGSAVLNRLSDVFIVYLTDGAPRDARFRSPHVRGSRDFYACVRAEEAACALAIAGVPAEQIAFLGGVDQESIAEVPLLLQAFVKVVREFQPSVIITHPYEGGHPDHDTAALIAQLATSPALHQGATAPGLLEMTSYHLADGKRLIGEFLPAESSPAVSSVTLKLTSEERAKKARMLGSYVSQWHILSEFPLEPERIRVAPGYDFTQPPHSGPLWYEYLDWPLSGMQWREAAGKVLEVYGHLPCH
jgi:N-acetylglucosamine malate deacetylase 2